MWLVKCWGQGAGCGHCSVREGGGGLNPRDGGYDWAARGGRLGGAAARRVRGQERLGSGVKRSRHAPLVAAASTKTDHLLPIIFGSAKTHEVCYQAVSSVSPPATVISRPSRHHKPIIEQSRIVGCQKVCKHTGANVNNINQHQYLLIVYSLIIEDGSIHGKLLLLMTMMVLMPLRQTV